MKRIPLQKKQNSKAGRIRLVVLASVALALLICLEIRVSALQSLVFGSYSDKLSFTIGNGGSRRIEFPQSGPFNLSRGYARIPEFTQTLKQNGFTIKEQTRFSPELIQLARWGINPPYPEPPASGLAIYDAMGLPIYDFAAKTRVFESFEDIPPLLVKTLLFIEDRQLGAPTHNRNNPVIDWGRLYHASLLYGGKLLGMETRTEGGSTLATQLEKYRYSSAGLTTTPTDKFRQMASATLKVYRDGSDTREARLGIVLDYLNTVPLSATPGYGEIYGFGEGLYAWFGVELNDLKRALAFPGISAEKVNYYKQTLTLLAAISAPSYYLNRDYPALQQRVSNYVRLLGNKGIIDSEFATQLFETSAPLKPTRRKLPQNQPSVKKAVLSLQSRLRGLLNEPDSYSLNRLSLEVDSTIDAELSQKTFDLLKALKTAEFIRRNSLDSRRLLRHGDPSKVLYSVLLYESTPIGNELRLHADTLNRSFDINQDLKLDLGSTAKLRTLMHYLEIVHELYEQYTKLSTSEKRLVAQQKLDPISRWAISALILSPNIGIEELLQEALNREYSTDSRERFFTGGGFHTFTNFDRDAPPRNITIRQALTHSVNLVFVRLMRDLVEYHSARLPYDVDELLANPNLPLAQNFLTEIAYNETHTYLEKFFRKYQNLSQEELIERFLGIRLSSARHLAITFFSWHPNGSEDGLSDWLTKWRGHTRSSELKALLAAYRRKPLQLTDYGYLLDKHPLEIWTGGELFRNAGLTWTQLVANSTDARKQASEWLLKTKVKKAQIRRLQTRIERDAFGRMETYWKRLGYPFQHLVPSLATALGSSSDRPAALAEFMGIIVNNGLKRPNISVNQLRFANKTPYHTVFEKTPRSGQRVLPLVITDALRDVLGTVVEHGTARRVKGALMNTDNLNAMVGGKTGSGDIRDKRFSGSGKLISSTPVNRTATFAFFIEDRYFGVITAYVPGAESENYRFTSSLPVSILALMAPAINERLQQRSFQLARID